MAIALVQSNKAGPTGGSASLSVTFSSSTTSGNLIVVAFAWDSNGTVSSVTDNKSNTYSAAGSVANNTNSSTSCMIYYAKNISGGASHQVTVTISASTTIRVAVAEYSGADTAAPLDQSAVGTGNTSSMVTSSVTLSANNELLACIGMISDGFFAAPTAGTGYTNRQTWTGANDAAYEDQILTGGSGSSKTGAMTGAGSGNYVIKLATFIPPSASGPTVGEIMSALQQINLPIWEIEGMKEG